MTTWRTVVPPDMALLLDAFLGDRYVASNTYVSGRPNVNALCQPRLAVASLLIAVALISAFAAGGTASAHSIGIGDVNCSEEIDSIDSSLILQYGAGLISTLECIDDADTNGDTYINSIDSSLILQFSAGLIDSLG